MASLIKTKEEIKKENKRIEEMELKKHYKIKKEINKKFKKLLKKQKYIFELLTTERKSFEHFLCEEEGVAATIIILRNKDSFRCLIEDRSRNIIAEAEYKFFGVSLKIDFTQEMSIRVLRSLLVNWTSIEDTLKEKAKVVAKRLRVLLHV